MGFPPTGTPASFTAAIPIARPLRASRLHVGVRENILQRSIFPPPSDTGTLVLIIGVSLMVRPEHSSVRSIVLGSSFLNELREEGRRLFTEELCRDVPFMR